MKRELDTADLKIVELLQEDARLPLKSIADKVSLTSPTVSARIDRLEKDGVITGYRASVNPEVFDYRIKAFINLEVEPVRKKEFYPYITNCPNVIECNCVTGDYSMLMEVVFHTTSLSASFSILEERRRRSCSLHRWNTGEFRSAIPESRFWSRKKKKVDFLRTFRYTKACYKNRNPARGRREKTRSEKQIKDG